MIETHTINLGSALLRTTNVNEMTPKKKNKKSLHLKFLLFSDIYRIQIVQNIAQLSSKGRFDLSPLFLNHWNFESN
jgi:hypothetical protein